MDYQSLHIKTVAELRKLAKDLQLRVPSGTKKEILIDMLLEADRQSAQAKPVEKKPALAKLVEDKAAPAEPAEEKPAPAPAAEEAPAAPRRRGRPRKNPLPEAAAEDSKPRRGRRPAQAAETASEKTPEEKAAPAIDAAEPAQPQKPRAKRGTKAASEVAHGQPAEANGIARAEGLPEGKAQPAASAMDAGQSAPAGAPVPADPSAKASAGESQSAASAQEKSATTEVQPSTDPSSAENQSETAEPSSAQNQSANAAPSAESSNGDDSGARTPAGGEGYYRTGRSTTVYGSGRYSGTQRYSGQNTGRYDRYSGAQQSRPRFVPRQDAAPREPFMRSRNDARGQGYRQDGQTGYRRPVGQESASRPTEPRYPVQDRRVSPQEGTSRPAESRYPAQERRPETASEPRYPVQDRRVSVPEGTSRPTESRYPAQERRAETAAEPRYPMQDRRMGVSEGAPRPAEGEGQDYPASEGYVARSADARPFSPAATEAIAAGEFGEGAGVLEIQPDGYGFLRAENCLPGPNDIYISQTQIRRFGLRMGDYVMGKTRPQREGDRYSAMMYISSVNGESPERAASRPRFEDLVPVYPDERLRLEPDRPTRQDLALRLIDMLAPIGKGQRGMIVSQPKAGKTTLLKMVANAITHRYPDVTLLVLLIDERPEEVTDMKRSIQGEVIYSTFDEAPENHTRVSEMVLERAQRMVEMGKDVVVLMDSITRLARAYNLVIAPTGRSLSGGLDPGALFKPKRFFGAARNIENGGSLTIIATALVDTGSRMDDIIYEEFKGTGNMELHLDRKLSDRRVFPAIDMVRSGTRREELLLTEEEMEGELQVRRMLSGGRQQEMTEELINLMSKTADNADFLQRLKGWKAVYEKSAGR